MAHPAASPLVGRDRSALSSYAALPTGNAAKLIENVSLCLEAQCLGPEPLPVCGQEIAIFGELSV